MVAAMSISTIVPCTTCVQVLSSWHVPAIFAEYNTVDANGNSVDLTNRRTEYTYSEKQDDGSYVQKSGSCKAMLTADDVANYSYENVIFGADHWNPRQLMEPVDAPKNIYWYKNVNKMSWTASEYAICYVVFDANDNVLAITKDANCEIEAGKVPAYIKAVNENGSLSQKYEVSVSTDIAQINSDTEVLRTEVYSVDGIRKDHAQAGLNIIKTTYKDGSVKTQKVVK